MFPVPASEHTPGVQTLLQGFSWSEATRAADLAQRNALLALHVKVTSVQCMHGACGTMLRCRKQTRCLTSQDWYNLKSAPAGTRVPGTVSDSQNCLGEGCREGGNVLLGDSNQAARFQLGCL